MKNSCLSDDSSLINIIEKCFQEDSLENILFLYHDNCWDGLSSAFVANKLFGDKPKYLAINYGKETDKLSFNDNKIVFMLDWCFKPKQLISVLEQNPNTLFCAIDHHKNNVEIDGINLFDLSERFNNFLFNFCNDKSGATLTYHFMTKLAFFMQEKNIIDFDFRKIIEKYYFLLLYIEDRDLWKFNLYESKAISAWIRSQTLSFESLEQINIILNYQMKECVALGKHFINHIDSLIKESIKHAHWVCVEGYTFPAVSGCLFFSEVASKLLDIFDTELAGVYFTRSDGIRQWSLRSRADFNVSKNICIKKGGGGHDTAGGFEEDASNPVVIIKKINNIQMNGII